MLPLPPILSQFQSLDQENLLYFVSTKSDSNKLHFGSFLLYAKFDWVVSQCVLCRKICQLTEKSVFL